MMLPDEKNVRTSGICAGKIVLERRDVVKVETLVIGLERDHHEAGIAGRVRRVDRREAGRQTNIRNDRREIARRDHVFRSVFEALGRVARSVRCAYPAARESR